MKVSAESVPSEGRSRPISSHRLPSEHVILSRFPLLIGTLVVLD